LKHYRKSQRCFVCGKQTFGVFNPAKCLIERLKLEEEGKTYKEADSDEELNNLELIMQPSGSTTGKPKGATADVEEPVTEIEHIHYADEGVVANDTDSDDDSD
jgi:RING finger protein 113A